MPYHTVTLSSSFPGTCLPSSEKTGSHRPPHKYLIEQLTAPIHGDCSGVGNSHPCGKQLHHLEAGACSAVHFTFSLTDSTHFWSYLDEHLTPLLLQWGCFIYTMIFFNSILYIF